jgi:group I intron endonuclease
MTKLIPKIGIYSITSPSGKMYIGKSKDIWTRWRSYRVKLEKKQTKLYYSFRKYGVKNHIFNIIELCSLEELSTKETFYISYFSTYNTKNGLNLTGGGDGPTFLTEEARKKIGDFHKGNKYNLGRKTSDITKEKLRNVLKDRIFTDEHKKRISESKKGFKHSDETKAKIREKRSEQVMKKGRVVSEETKLKISNSKKGKKMPEEQRLRLSEYMKTQPYRFKNVKQLKLNTMKSINEVYNQLCNTPSDIYQLLPFIKKYAEQSKHITEMGTRGVVSTYAFLEGKPDKLISYDIQYHPNVEECKELCQKEGLNWEFVIADVLKIEIEETDFLFIDTFHTASQLEKELALHSDKVRKFIGFHDTDTFWETGEAPYEELGDHTGLSCGRGLKYALEPFLVNNPQWKVAFKTAINNGLTIIERING